MIQRDQKEINMSENPDRNAVKQSVPLDPETGKPYINTVAAVAIAPSGTGSELSEYVAQSVDVIRQSGLPNETNAMFTNIEGDLDDVLKTVRDATMVLAAQGYRTGVTLKLDIRPGFSGQIKEKQQLVDDILSQTK
ncbi:thiamine-binding protein [Bifidobacterium sp. ESL0800]|uniref:thiamine-binding protein n=1 Tax=Bifidobacterium sp. ESL0800 TaxID=2983236 RepID=UPI0023F83B47|nr:thiamine-binding protein [Bifidobacterium sp. ESL0800]WEV76499.1 thiamine-binding protein [Bifidobacterium sp. ESL0800]